MICQQELYVISNKTLKFKFCGCLVTWRSQGGYRLVNTAVGVVSIYQILYRSLGSVINFMLKVIDKVVEIQLRYCILVDICIPNLKHSALVSPITSPQHLLINITHHMCCSCWFLVIFRYCMSFPWRYRVWCILHINIPQLYIF